MKCGWCGKSNAKIPFTYGETDGFVHKKCYGELTGNDYATNTQDGKP